MRLYERALSTSHGGARSTQNCQYLNGLPSRVITKRMGPLVLVVANQTVPPIW